MTQDERGLTLIEVLIATVLVAIVGVGVALMFSTGQRMVADEGDNRVALGLAQQKVEQLRMQGGGLTPDVCLDASGVCTSTASMTTGGVTKNYTVTFMVKCVRSDNYDAPPEGCLGAVQYAQFAKLIAVCVVEGVFVRACAEPSGGTTMPRIPPSVVASNQHVVVLRSVLSPRF